jgi:hypothetical protein
VSKLDFVDSDRSGKTGKYKYGCGKQSSCFSPETEGQEAACTGCMDAMDTEFMQIKFYIIFSQYFSKTVEKKGCSNQSKLSGIILRKNLSIF